MAGCRANLTFRTKTEQRRTESGSGAESRFVPYSIWWCGGAAGY
ncbi:hypothetical protein KKY_2933 [Pelagibacterium halotolerans B2]|uniref:Uncharacterized protein n=1 Tax=Pelagibacterium halotolerans (strain DSM 22347 / JCM 15775 / CGMCC 1.7692 / B2) TaxID=1082931 RepID=G4REZ5_PELHB|nr:hypothetical protein KKY_2933 [Pelagibacterium halotolerans B2]